MTTEAVEALLRLHDADIRIVAVQNLSDITGRRLRFVVEGEGLPEACRDNTAVQLKVEYRQDIERAPEVIDGDLIYTTKRPPYKLWRLWTYEGGYNDDV